MTIAAKFERRRKRILASVFSGMILFMASIVVGDAVDRKFIPFLAFAALLPIIAVTSWAHLLGFLCPECRGNMAALYLSRPDFWRSLRLRFCPYCGHELDGTCESSGTNDQGGDSSTDVLTDRYCRSAF